MTRSLFTPARQACLVLAKICDDLSDRLDFLEKCNSAMADTVVQFRERLDKLEKPPNDAEELWNAISDGRHRMVINRTDIDRALAKIDQAK